ncbi:MAG: hypothetical protein H0T42_00735 [Deltaproteobacteria bacterium]|nr:hypothetical protein [Deltaproteobacteria bacterium]
MRRTLLALVVAVTVAVGSSTPVVEAEVAAEARAESFPLPKDAVSHDDGKSKKSSDRIRTYDVPRGRDAVVTEARTALKARKWEIVKDEPATSGNAVRLTVKKHGRTFKASITGDEKRAVIIVTAPIS